MPWTGTSARTRDTKQQEEPSDSEADIESLDEYIIEVKSRRVEVHAHGCRMIHDLVTRQGGLGPDRTEAVLDACRMCLDRSRDSAVRLQLVNIASILMMSGDAPKDFAAEFTEALAREVPNLWDSEDDVVLVDSIFHAITVAQAVHDYKLKLDRELLSTYLLSQKAPKVHETAVAFTRLMAVTATEADHGHKVAQLVRDQLHRHAEHPALLAKLIKTVAIAVEVHGHDHPEGLDPALVEQYAAVSGKGEGGKDAKKELAAVARTVEDFLKNGTKPHHVIKLQVPHSRNEHVDATLETYQQIAVLDSVRHLAGQHFYLTLLESPVVGGLFGIDTTDEWGHRRFRQMEERQAARFDRGVDEKHRYKGRDAARMRKTSHLDADSTPTEE